MNKKEELDKLIERCRITPIGNGYIDLICPKEYIKEFIEGLSKLEISIMGFCWWCNVTGKHKPCGMGGPKNKYNDNWYSEVQTGEIITFKSYEEFLNYLTIEWKNEIGYKECYVPGFWINVPKEWEFDKI